MIPPVTPQILLCIQVAKAEGSGKLWAQQQIMLPARTNIKTTRMGTDDEEYVASETDKWTLLVVRSNTVSLRWEGQVNNVIV